MNRKLHYLFGTAIVVVLLVVGLWTQDLASNTPTTADQDQEVQVVIIAQGEEVNTDTLMVAADTTLMELMQQHYDLIVTADGFVESIEGIEQEPEKNLYWVYEVNEEQVTEGAETFIPEENDTIIWELTAF
ncbi:DUF4430 domain-containing protein [Alkalibacterium olivapovliticus]|uniref:Uncharacterized protein DUF4430 n=1 Tax=Alkalibacterium olivapovliticus TaxID=99907 RepID=A0A2T0WAJ7_9LACT|nr:DUF4430 domain-containing protein [Alkalibacterium olivapovliticus]PRY83656.1 uncharacterized protein DUF4430 [Alkalibacterium olivapovliticus]